MTFGIKSNDVHSSPKERQLKKTCVSFGEECTVIVRVPHCFGVSQAKYSLLFPSSTFD